MEDSGFIQNLKSQGWDITGRTATFSEWKVQAIKEAIIENNLRPTIPDTVRKIYKDIITQCWVYFFYF